MSVGFRFKQHSKLSMGISKILIIVGIYLVYRNFIKPYMIDAPAIRKRKEEIEEKEKENDKGDFIDYEEVE